MSTPQSNAVVAASRNPNNDDNDDLDDSFIINTVITAVLAYAAPLYSKQPYHSCRFKGLDWVHDLMEGHPERIRHELGVHLPVFNMLLHILEKIGYSDSRHVKLEEQLAIFLYTCVTGLSIRHVGERFQRANDTISK